MPRRQEVVENVPPNAYLPLISRAEARAALERAWAEAEAEAEATAERQQSFQRQVQQARATIHVAAGALCRPGRVLLGQRAPGGVLGGLWEFPGGGR